MTLQMKWCKQNFIRANLSLLCAEDIVSFYVHNKKEKKEDAHTHCFKDRRS